MHYRALLILPIDLSDAVIDGRTLVDILFETCERAGVHAQVVAPSDAVGDEPALVIDGLVAAIPPGALRRVLGGGAVVDPDGRVVAAWSPPSEGAVAAALHGEHPVMVGLSADQAARIDSPWGLARVEVALCRARVRDLVEAGVRVIDPDRVLVEPTVRVEGGATLWPDVVLRGATVVGAGAEVQSGCWLVDTQVAAGALIKPHCVLEGAVVGPEASVGPFAHLRPGAVLERAVKVGNFVEVKKSVLHEGAKASHLTYLGDAEIGPGANIGAGTITCNYDGFGKHRTTIGAGAFVGSNSALVAPVNIGPGAIVGAGSVVHRDVPQDSVAIERAPLRILEGKAPILNERNRAKAKPRS